MQAPSFTPVAAPQINMGAITPPVNGGAPSAAPGVPATTHTAQTDPELKGYLERVKTRLDNPGDITRETNQAGQQIQAFAEGERNQLSGNLAQRGILGSGGSEAGMMGEIGARAQASFGKAAEGIALQRARDNDAMLLGAQGAFVEPGRQGLADRSLGIQAAGQADNSALARQRMSLDAQLAQANLVQNAQQMNWQQQMQAAQLAAQQQAQVLSAYGSIYR
jgi:hypothetical protein